jgi:outer membrane lipoprotein-sorting protein
LCAFVAFGESSPLARAQQAIDSHACFQTRFDLEIFWKTRQKKEHKQGTLLYAEGDKFKVTLDALTWVSDGYTYWQYSKKSNQVVIKNLLDVDVAYHPSMLFSRYLTNDNYTPVDTSGAHVVYADTSRAGNKNEQVNELQVWVDRDDGVIDKIRMTDVNGNVSTYTFDKWKFGVQYSKDTFTFEPPADARVLDTRQ